MVQNTLICTVFLPVLAALYSSICTFSQKLISLWQEFCNCARKGFFNSLSCPNCYYTGAQFIVEHEYACEQISWLGSVCDEIQSSQTMYMSSQLIASRLYFLSRRQFGHINLLTIAWSSELQSRSA